MQRDDVTRRIGLLVIVGGLMLLPGCLVDFTSPCCPSAVVFMAQDPWICPSNCPGGGVTRLNYEIQFEQDGKACDPGDDFTIFIENVTNGVILLPLVWDNPGTGLYEGTVEVTLTQDTTYRVEATRENVDCGTAEAELTIQVVDQGDSHQISLSGILDPPNCTLDGGFVSFGPGVLVDHIENLNSYHIAVTKDTHTELILPNGQGYAIGGANEPAAGNWSIGLSDSDECHAYANLLVDQQFLSIKVFLQCDCPPVP